MKHPVTGGVEIQAQLKLEGDLKESVEWMRT